MEKLSSKEKIDQLLGIDQEKSIDDFLNDLSIDANNIQNTIQTIDKSVKQNIENVDNQISMMQNKDASCDVQSALVNINQSMNEIEELISLSKNMFKHIYCSITTTDLIDSEAVSSAAKLLECIHLNIAEFISLYKDKQSYIEKIKIMTFQQEQKKELMMLKHKLDLEKIQLKQAQQTETIDAEGSIAYSLEDITKILDDQDKNI